MLHLKAAFLPEKELSYRKICTLSDRLVTLHNHDFYEIMLILEGKMFHAVNDKTFILRPRNLIFIRPEDKHFVHGFKKENCIFINLEFAAQSIQSLFSYLGAGFDPSFLISPPHPPTLLLNSFQHERLHEILDEIGAISAEKKGLLSLTLRKLLFEIVFLFYPQQQTNTDPQWLTALQTEMRKVKNLQRGISRMIEITHFTPEHLCRTLKKHTGRTPSQLLNEMRLQYSANLLACSDLPITDIALEAGYNNINYFYRKFHEQFNSTPKAYRNVCHGLSIK